MYQTFFGGGVVNARPRTPPRWPARSQRRRRTGPTTSWLPQTISKEPLGPFTAHGDDVWTDIIAWLHYGLIEAEEFGVTASNTDEMSKSTTPANPASARPPP